MASRPELLSEVNRQVVACSRCPRLVAYRQRVAREKRRAFQHWDYWGKPVPGFGDPQAQLFILGLAPAAHGGNRTGRVFTGDQSGDFLYDALYRTGFANQPTSRDRNDGLELRNAYIAAAARCAPPANKPLASELDHCRPYVERELQILRPRAVLALGRIAMVCYLETLKRTGAIRNLSPYPFLHGARYRFPDHLPELFASYHPSQRNTFTGKLTKAMLVTVLRTIRKSLESGGDKS